MAADFSAASYLNSQKVRTRVEAHFRWGAVAVLVGWAGGWPGPGQPALLRWTGAGWPLHFTAPYLPAPARRAFSRCDFILTPSLPCTAPPIKPAALRSGETGAPPAARSSAACLPAPWCTVLALPTPPLHDITRLPALPAADLATTTLLMRFMQARAGGAPPPLPSRLIRWLLNLFLVRCPPHPLPRTTHTAGRQLYWHPGADRAGGCSAQHTQQQRQRRERRRRRRRPAAAGGAAAHGALLARGQPAARGGGAGGCAGGGGHCCAPAPCVV